MLIKNAHGLPMNIDRSFCRYKFYHDKQYTQTEEIGGTINPVFEHEKKIAYKAASKRVGLTLRKHAHAIYSTISRL